MQARTGRLRTLFINMLAVRAAVVNDKRTRLELTRHVNQPNDDHCRVKGIRDQLIRLDLVLRSPIVNCSRRLASIGDNTECHCWKPLKPYVVRRYQGWQVDAA